jgi:hypothetical protein
MSQPNNSQNLFYPRGNNKNVGIYGTEPARKRLRSNNNSGPFIPKYNNHAKLIQVCINKVNVVNFAGNPQNTSPMYKELAHYEEIEKIAKDKQQLILAELEAHNSAFNGGSKRKTRRNKH